MREPGSGKRVRQTGPFVVRLGPPPQIGSSDPSADRLQQQRHRQSIPTEPQAPDAMGVYVISVAARILAMHPQTLRKYERLGLVKPSRTEGMLRLYTHEDIVKLRMIKHLVDNVRLNLAGVEVVMSMVERLMAFRQRLAPTRNPQRRALERELQMLLDSLQAR